MAAAVVPMVCRCRRDCLQKKEVEEVDWESLRPEILTEIAKRLPTLEIFECFGSVCRSWRAAAASCFPSEFPHGKTTLEGPWLLLPGEAEKEECFVISRRYLLGGTITRKLVDLPPGVTKNYDHNQYFLSCKDWLLVVSRDEDDARLVHPLSRVQIHLPSLATLRQHAIDFGNRPTIRTHKIIHKFLLSADPFSTQDDDFFVIVTWGQYYSLGFCKPRDMSWKKVANDRPYFHHHFHELMYNREDNKLYALSLAHMLAVCDIHGPGPIELRILYNLVYPPSGLLGRFRHAIGYPRSWSGPFGRTHRNKRYMLEWNKKNTVLVVYHHLYTKRNALFRSKKDFDYRFETLGFVVEEVNLADGTCSDVTNLGNISLFVGGNSSFYVDCSKSVNKNIKPNCIYFAGYNFFWLPFWTRELSGCRGTSEIGIYNLGDGCFEYVFSYDDNEVVIRGTNKTSPPIWFGPSF